ncbi:MAG: sugar phosphate isomerase/epimerase family protein [bacterium]
MNQSSISRRGILTAISLAAGAAWTRPRIARAEKNKAGGNLHLASNHYSWIVFFNRDKRDFNQSLDEGLKEVAASGIDGFEANVNGPEDIERFAPLLEKHGLEMRSFYVNSVLHTAEEAEKSLKHVLAIAEKAQAIGTKIIVTNPSPIQWGGAGDKTDDQLKIQAEALEQLGKELHGRGLILAYHNHDMELRNAAREFHHMMVGTDPRYVTLCLDSHWIYRGSGNSQVALFDIVKLYGKRVTELHLRQSVNHAWAETFGEGDIDYPALAQAILAQGVKPHLVLEQAVETGTPQSLSPVEAHRRSVEYARRVFAAMS